jgi:hypothetical protein
MRPLLATRNTGAGPALGGTGHRPTAGASQENAIDIRSRRQKIVRDDPDAKAILLEPRSVKKQISTTL